MLGVHHRFSCRYSGGLLIPELSQLHQNNTWDLCAKEQKCTYCRSPLILSYNSCSKMETNTGYSAGINSNPPKNCEQEDYLKRGERNEMRIFLHQYLIPAYYQDNWEQKESRANGKEKQMRCILKQAQTSIRFPFFMCWSFIGSMPLPALQTHLPSV